MDQVLCAARRESSVTERSSPSQVTQCRKCHTEYSPFFYKVEAENAYECHHCNFERRKEEAELASLAARNADPVDIAPISAA